MTILRPHAESWLGLERISILGYVTAPQGLWSGTETQFSQMPNPRHLNTRLAFVSVSQGQGLHFKGKQVGSG